MEPDAKTKRKAEREILVQIAKAIKQQKESPGSLTDIPAAFKQQTDSLTAISSPSIPDVRRVTASNLDANTTSPRQRLSGPPALEKSRLPLKTFAYKQTDRQPATMTDLNLLQSSGMFGSLTEVSAKCECRCHEQMKTEDLKRRLAECRKENSQLTNDLAAIHRELVTVVDMFESKLETSIREKDEKLKAAMEEIVKLKDTVETSRNLARRLRSQLENLGRRCQGLIVLADNEIEEKNILAKDYQVFKSMIEEKLAGEISKREAYINQMNAKLKDLQKEFDESRKEAEASEALEIREKLRSAEAARNRGAKLVSQTTLMLDYPGLCDDLSQT